CLREHESRVEVRIFLVTAITRVPVRVEGQLHQVGEAQDTARSGRLATMKSSEGLEINWLCTLGHQVSIEKRRVCDLVISVVLNVVRKIIVKVFELFLVLRVAASTWNFVVLYPSKFVVLNPKVNFQDFGRRNKP